MPSINMDWRNEWIKSNHGKKDLEISVDEKMDMTCQCALIAQKANHILSCIKSVASKAREVFPPVNSPFVRPHLKCCIQLWRPQCKKDSNLLEQVHRWSLIMVQGLVHISYGQELAIFSLENSQGGPY
ncbi:hypothetical protein TURU_168375 [Turdus rufiventris]|nr:hypothetical protein TURU_168375 [Turdus rufiventris]